MNRRQFLMSSVAATSVVAPSIAVSSPLASSDAEATAGPRVAVLLVDTDRVAAPIDKRIYGHFLEHINHSVVDGLPGSPECDCPGEPYAGVRDGPHRGPGPLHGRGSRDPGGMIRGY